MEPSYVLRALGVPDALAYASIRFSLGRVNDPEQIDFAVATVVECVEQLRGVVRAA
jgi:cysteine desulfurase